MANPRISRIFDLHGPTFHPSNINLKTERRTHARLTLPISCCAANPEKLSGFLTKVDHQVVTVTIAPKTGKAWKGFATLSKSDIVPTKKDEEKYPTIKVSLQIKGDEQNKAISDLLDLVVRADKNDEHAAQVSMAVTQAVFGEDEPDDLGF